MTFREFGQFVTDGPEWQVESSVQDTPARSAEGRPKISLNILIPAIQNYRFLNRAETIEMIRSGNPNAVVSMWEYRILAANKAPQTRRKINQYLSDLSGSLLHIAGFPIDPIEYLMCLYYQKNGDQEDGLTLRDMSDRLEVLGIDWTSRVLNHFMGTTLGWPLRSKTDRTAAREKRWMKNYTKWLRPFNTQRTRSTEVLVEQTITEILSVTSHPGMQSFPFDLSEYRTLDSTAKKLVYLLRCQWLVDGSDESIAQFLRQFIDRGISTRKAVYILTRLNTAFLSSRYPTRFRELVPTFWAATFHRFATHYLWEGYWFFPASS